METTKMKIEYRKQIDSETAPWQLLTNMDELLWNGIYNLRVTDDDGTHSLPFRFANDDTVTLVVKDHAHEGMLENGRTIVHTITRVERSTGNVLSYTRTRYNSNGSPTWSYWTLAGEDDAVIEIPKATPVSLGAVIVGYGLAVDADGKVSLAEKSIGESLLAIALKDKINEAATKANATDLFVQNSGLTLHYGALLRNDAPYPGTNLRVHTDKILSAGEQFVVNDGYVISALKIFDGEQEIAYANNLSEPRYTLDAKGLHYQFEFSKLNMTPFTDDELPQVIKAYNRRPIVWSSTHHINHFVAAGTYNISGQRTNAADGLPIANAASGHSINASLVVLDSSIPASSKESDKCITQILTLSNRVGGDGDIYVRTGRAADTVHLIAGNGWGTWGKLQQNIEVGQTASLDAYIDNGIYSGVYTNGSTFFETFVMVVINNYAVAAATGTARNITQVKYAVDTNGVFCYHVRTGQGADSVEWGDWRDLDAVTTDRIQDGAVTAQKLSDAVAAQINNNTAAIVAERTRAMGQEGLLNSAFEAEKQRAMQAEKELENKIDYEDAKFINGDTIVGLAREVYSRQGKTDTATFLKRTTAGGTSISDGVATLKQIGGNIVKNLLDISTATYSIGGGTFEYNNIGIITCTSNPTNLVFKELEYISNHIYYGFVEISHDGTVCSFSLGGASDVSRVGNVWETLSCIGTLNSTSVNIYLNGATVGFVKRFNIIDLSEMFGAGNEPTKEECDKMFGTMDALPYGLTVANPTAFKSIGYNQWNPANLFTGKTVADKAIVDGNNSIAFFECLPCKIGAGENNGYVIGYGEGDDWSDAGIEVYLTPIYPMTGDGLLYAHKLEKDAATGTYIPKIKGYLLVVTPIVDKLCAHFLWSGDRAMSDYEPYTESTISLPVVPQMSEWGLAGMCVNGELVQDVIDLENNLYIKRIGKNAEGFYPLEVQEEYPIVTRNAPNYIGSDYGVEQFVGSKVPLVANILFYMRSLVSETRNFLDRMYDNTAKTDAKEVADYITSGIEGNKELATNVIPELTTNINNANFAIYTNALNSQSGGNIFDKNAVGILVNKTFKDIYGNIEDREKYNISDYMAVVPGEAYVMSATAGNPQGYNADKEPIGKITATSGVFTVPEGVYWIRVSYYQGWTEGFCINKGTTIPPTKERTFGLVRTEKLSDNVVTTEKIADNAVTINKLSDEVRERVLSTPVVIRKNGAFVVEGTLSSGEKFELPQNSISVGEYITFSANINGEFGALYIGHGRTNGAYMKITSNEVVAYSHVTSPVSEKTFEHGITIENNIQVYIEKSKNSTTTLTVASNGKSYTFHYSSWYGNKGTPFVESDGCELTDCSFGWTCKAVNSDVWAFGDSYFGVTGTIRWMAYLIAEKHTNLVVNGYGGQGSAAAYTDLTNLLTIGTPKKILWCLGMNDADSSTSVNANWLNTYNSLKALCENNNIELILATIPTVPTRIHKFKNDIIRSSGCRYIDFDKAVGADEGTGVWFGDMLSSDGVHPSETGALTLYNRAITDMPELLNC